jgi:hypothetical protein
LGFNAHTYQAVQESIRGVEAKLEKLNNIHQKLMSDILSKKFAPAYLVVLQGSLDFSRSEITALRRKEDALRREEDALLRKELLLMTHALQKAVTVASTTTPTAATAISLIGTVH